MKVLVLSDSHNDIASMHLAVKSNSYVDAVVFLGDGYNDWTEIATAVQGKQLIAVSGNCDSMLTPCPLRAVESIGGIIFYCTHGHIEYVKHGLDTLKHEAREAGATVALYGHTHKPLVTYDDGIYIMNPGSVRQNSCGIVNITPKGILCYTKKIVVGY